MQNLYKYLCVQSVNIFFCLKSIAHLQNLWYNQIDGFIPKDKWERGEDIYLPTAENIEKAGPIAIADYYILNDGDRNNLIKKLDEIYDLTGYNFKAKADERYTAISY